MATDDMAQVHNRESSSLDHWKEREFVSRTLRKRSRFWRAAHEFSLELNEIIWKVGNLRLVMLKDMTPIPWNPLRDSAPPLPVQSWTYSSLASTPHHCKVRVTSNHQAAEGNAHSQFSSKSLSRIWFLEKVFSSFSPSPSAPSATSLPLPDH